ncbi:PROM1 protein, partial [Oreotrochilus melanogaster]|nr:PROM1 protein [Oreotrochilus melanogaster]
MELGNISKTAYGLGLEAPGSNTPGLVEMVHGFLRLVQPNALPVGGCTADPQSWGDLQLSVILSSQLFHYQLGFLVCVAIGLLFIIFVPLVGCCFCCCRC